MMENNLNNKLNKMAKDLTDVLKSIESQINTSIPNIKDEKLKKFFLDSLSKAKKGEITSEEFTSQLKELMSK